MKFITNIIKKFLPKKITKPVGRWKIEYCNVQINNKVDLSNEDHCGPCGQYALEKKELNNNNDIQLHRPKRKMRQTFYKKIKNLSIFLFGDVKAPLKGVILFDDYNLL